MARITLLDVQKGAVTRKKFRAAAACFEDQTDDGEAGAGAEGFWAISGMAKPIWRVLAHIQG
ncbi:MAG: hypothetical protein RSJ41_07760, partial [Clostridia bacterium]